ncbi:MAG TPA: site-specific DNA-methyltransferase [Rhizomicrobium sp.]|nr:site-specific DNA-methyltransferase [Rhizomicrobium sp.]
MGCFSSSVSFKERTLPQIEGNFGEQVTDYILFYSKSEDYIWNRPVEPWTPERSKEYQYKESDTGRRYMRVPVHAPGSRNGATGMEWRGKLPPPGKHWQFTPEALDEMDRRGEIVWSKNGNPRRKVYLDQSSGIPVQDVWMDFKDAHNQNIHVTGYPTEKNLDMLKRIVAASSNPNDLVMDCFCGSGTTLMAAESLGRQWIGADRSPEAIRTILTRFSKGTSPMGDFVDKDDGTPSLFETEPLQVNSTHKGITEFEFLAEETDRDAAYALIKDAGFSYTEIDAAEVRVA